MNTFVVGSNVDGGRAMDYYLKIISEYHVALVYYNPSGRIKRKFDEIQKGDLVIIAYGSNKYKKCFFAGYAKSSNQGAFKINNETIDGHIYLDNFISLKNHKIPFSTKNTCGETQQPPAVYQLNTSNSDDTLVIDIIQNIIRKENNKMENEIFDLLTSNHNLVLTGAPGTGKTYLAKQIAAKMIFGEDITLENIEKDEAKKAKFEYQYKFVQFHPSYDYTDFVEGIRPVTKEDNSYGFVRKDGTFKEFCQRAAKNIVDSQKTVDELSNEEVILKYLDEYTNFIIEQLDENDKYYIGDSNETLNLYMNDFKQDNKGILFSFENNQNKVRMYFEEIIDMYNFYSDVMKNEKKYLIKDFLEYTERKSRHATFYCRFIKDFYNKYSEKIDKDLKNKFTTTVKQAKFVFIIDEINRGDINKILGELFYAIDTGYRGEKGRVDTQYQNLVESGDIFAKGFYIPENVYIIGTMNDIDRSVESIDFAIRRRFAWKEIAPEETAEDILKAVKVDGAYNIFNALNNFITSAEGLGKMYQIGASYFLKLNSYVENSNVTAEEAYNKLWDNHLKGLFFEYVRGKKNADDIFSNIENTYFNTVNEILAN